MKMLIGLEHLSCEDRLREPLLLSVLFGFCCCCCCSPLLSGEEKALGIPHCSLPVLEGNL